MSEMLQVNADIMDELLRIPVEPYGDIEKISDTLSKCKVRIFYKGMNRNRTFISDEFAEQLISSLPYAPIKGIFNYANEDFEDHGDDNTDGRIYGIIPENPNFEWVKHVDDDGVEREYATADVILFTGLYPEASIVPGSSQSMEIFRDTLKGEWRIWEDGKPYYHFQSGSLLGLQVLGNVAEPCFEGAAFFSLYQEFQNCLKYLKNNQQEVDKKMEEIIKYRLSDSEKACKLEQVLNPEGSDFAYGIVDVYDEYAVCRNIPEGKFERIYYTKNDETNEVSIGEKIPVYVVDVTETEYTALQSLKAIGTYSEINDKFAELQSKIAEYEAAATETEEASVTEESSVENEVVVEPAEDFAAKIAELQETISAYEAQISELKAEKDIIANEKNDLFNEKEELVAFKKNVENEKKNSIIDEFSSHLTDEQIESYKADMDKYSVSDFRKEVCTAAYDSDPAIFSRESNLIPKVDATEEDRKTDTGVLRILNKYKNGGNK